MSEAAPRESPRAAQLYVAAVGLVGAAVAVYCATVLVRHGVPGQWLLFAALTFACGRFTLVVPGVDARFSVSEMVGLSCVLLFGPEAGAITLAVDSLIVSFVRRMKPGKVAFNCGNLALSVWLSGTFFFAAAGTGPLFGQSTSSAGLVVPLGIMAATYFLVNSGLIAIAIALTAGERPFAVWRSHFMWLGPGYAAGACIALLLVVAHRQVDFSALALLPPVMLVSFLMLRSSFGRLEDAKQHVDRLNGLYLSTIETLATAIDAKDDVTHGHVRRVQAASVALAKDMGISDPQIIRAIEAAGLLHDTGKIGVPEHILNKPSRLTPAEFEKMKLHAPIGAEILSSIDFPFPVVPIVRHHHENWDGTGYPDGLRGTDIPIGARILSVVDCFDALTSDRPYRSRMSDEDALQIIVARRGTMYDPLIVDHFVKVCRDVMPVADTVPHPAARAVSSARTPAAEAEPAVRTPPTVVPDEVVAFASLSRAMTGQAGVHDIGALAWALVRPLVPCDSMALFVADEALDLMVPAYAAGLHADALRSTRHRMADGPVGWTAVNRRPIINGEAPELKAAAPGEAPAIRACTVPLQLDDRGTAVAAYYANTAFSDRDAQLLELLAPTLAAALAPVVHAAPAATGARRAPHGELRIVRGASA